MPALASGISRAGIGLRKLQCHCSVREETDHGIRDCRNDRNWLLVLARRHRLCVYVYPLNRASFFLCSQAVEKIYDLLRRRLICSHVF